MAFRSLVISSVSLLLFWIPLKAQLPYTFDAGTYGCPTGASGFVVGPTVNILGTTFDSLYQSYCTSTGNYTYSLTNADFVPGDTYDIVIHFAEIYFGPGNIDPTGGVGSRIFSLDIEGITALDSLDVYKKVGPNTALAYRFRFKLESDGILDLGFTSHVGQPILNAIEILPVGHPIFFPPGFNLIDMTQVLLPVELEEFSAYRQDDASVSLEWFASEIDPATTFSIQMKSGQEDFRTLTSLKAAPTQQAFSFLTQPLHTGTYQFRLRYEGNDGVARFSEIREVRIIPVARLNWSLFPNPASQSSTIHFATPLPHPAHISIYNMQGQEMEASTIPSLSSEYLIETRHFPAGIYLVVVNYQGQVSRMKLKRN